MIFRRFSLLASVLLGVAAGCDHAPQAAADRWPNTAEAAAFQPQRPAAAQPAITGPVREFEGFWPRNLAPRGYWRTLGNEVPDWSPDMHPQRAGGLNWQPVGPHPVGLDAYSGPGNASGRVVSIAPHPTDPATCYIASASGGIWKTLDGGVTWTPIGDELGSLNYGAIAVCAGDPEVVVAATGEFNTGTQGGGAYRSLDGGATWARIGTTSQIGARSSGIFVDPIDPDVIHITSSSGYRRTFDGGATWIGPVSGLPTGSCSSLAISPADPLRVYVARYGDGVYVSSDGGDNFTKQTLPTLPATGNRNIVVAVAPSDPTTAYAAVIGPDGNLRAFYQGGSGGWSLRQNTPNFPSGYGEYSCFVSVDPSAPGTVYAGGYYGVPLGVAGVVRSTTGGASWTSLIGHYHPNQHTMAWDADGNIWLGTEGGVWRSETDGLDWINCNADLQITQVYTVAVNPQAGEDMLAGTQGSGNVRHAPESLVWNQQLDVDGRDGEGGFAAYDSASRFYATSNFLRTIRYNALLPTDITGPWMEEANGFFIPTEAVNFIAPMIMDPRSSSTLYGGTYRVWRTGNAQTSAPTWISISDARFDPGDPLTALAIAENAPGTVLYAGSTAGRLLITSDGLSWTDRTSTSFPAVELTDLIIDPRTSGDTAYASFFAQTGARIFKTTDRGQTWTSVTGNLTLGVRVTALAADWFGADPPTLYAGTGSGIYVSADDGATWIKDGPEFPNVNVGDLVIDGRTLIAATYGRGVWRASLDASACDQTVIEEQPEAQAVCFGDPVSFSVSATGTGLQYQWRHNGEIIEDATAPLYIIDAVDEEDLGFYSCGISNSCGESVVTLSAELTVADLTVSEQPASHTVCEDSLAFFVFTVTGAPGITYQWYKDGDPIEDGIGPAYVILSATQLDEGFYTCRATTACGTVLSEQARLIVNSGPGILQQPQSRTVSLGQQVTFSVAASGTPPLSYQWRKDGSAIPGATSASYTIASAGVADIGGYTVVITNSCDSTTSQEARLSLDCPADFNGDGLVDFADYLEFLNLFDASDPRADLNQDGVVDFGDYLEFLNHFDAGC